MEPCANLQDLQCKTSKMMVSPAGFEPTTY